MADRVDRTLTSGDGLEAQPVEVNIETLLRRHLTPDMLSRSAQETVDELLSKSAEPLTPERRKRMIAAAERSLRVRREILNLAAFASGHRPEARARHRCRECHADWPCADVRRAAGPALDAVAELRA